MVAFLNMLLICEMAWHSCFEYSSLLLVGLYAEPIITVSFDIFNFLE